MGDTPNVGMHINLSTGSRLDFGYQPGAVSMRLTDERYVITFWLTSAEADFAAAMLRRRFDEAVVIAKANPATAEGA